MISQMTYSRGLDIYQTSNVLSSGNYCEDANFEMTFLVFESIKTFPQMHVRRIIVKILILR